MRRYIVLALLLAVLAVVQAGNPECQRNGEMTARLAEGTEHIMSDSYQRGGRARATKSKPEQKSKPDTPVVLAKDYTQLPATFDGYTGPHGDSRIYGRNFTSRAGIKSRTCQIDCKSTVEGNKKLFSNCRSRFYSYGTDSKYGCLGTAAMMERQAQIVLDVCHHYNKCKVNFTPTSLLKTMRNSRGINTIASRTMSTFARELEQRERENQAKAKELLKQGPDALKNASPAVRYEMRAILEQDRAKAVSLAMKSGNYNLARAIKAGVSNVGMQYGNGAKYSGAPVGKRLDSSTGFLSKIFGSRNTATSKTVAKTSSKGLFGGFFSSSRSSSPRGSFGISKIGSTSSVGSTSRSIGSLFGSKSSSFAGSSSGKSFSFSRSSSPSSAGKVGSSFGHSSSFGSSSSSSRSSSSSSRSSSSGSSGKSSSGSSSSGKSGGSSGGSSGGKSHA